MRIGVIGAALCLSLIGVSHAQTAHASIRKTTDIPAESLSEALRTLAKDRQFEILYRAETVRDVRTEGAAGEYTPEEALKQLLSGTGLTYKYLDDKTVTIVASSAPSGTSAAAGQSQTTQDTKEAGNKNSQDFRVAQVDQNAAGPQVASDDQIIAEKKKKPDEAISEILVIGSKSFDTDIRRTQDDIQPYVVFDRRAIETSGATTVDEFLRDKLTSATPSASTNQASGQGGFANTSIINLRGLGADQTLILIDGHRSVSLGFGGLADQPDLNGIPLAAIERIEVLPTTASGIYGGGATGGVINVILRRDYTGIETKVTYGDSFDGGGANRRIDASAGFNLEGGKTNILFSGSYSNANSLPSRDRDFESRALNLILANNPGTLLGAFQPPLGATTNICSATVSFGFGFCSGAPLTLKSGASLGSGITFIPYGYAGPSSDGGAALLANAGRYNLNLANTAQLGAGGYGLLNGPTVESGMASIKREFSPNVQAFLDLSASNNEGWIRTNPVSGAFAIPAGSAANPFNQDIEVTTPLFGGDGVATSSVQNRRIVGGVIVRLGAGWTSEADYTWNTSQLRSTVPAFSIDSTSATNDLSSGVLNVFRDTNANPVSFARYMLPAGGVSPTVTTLKDATVRVSGPFPWALPGGAPTITALIERRQEFEGDSTQIIPLAPQETLYDIAYSRSQSTTSAYVESILPLLSAQNNIAGVHLLEFQISGRWERYSTIGASQSSSIPGLFAPTPPEAAVNRFSAVNPTVGLKFQPVGDVTLRASFGTGFLPPQLNQLSSSVAALDNPTQYTDPARNNEPIGLHGPVLNPSGGNANLTPEKSRSISFGTILTPRFVPDFRLSVDWTRIRKTDEISQACFGVFGLQQTIDECINVPGFVTRGPSLGDGLPGPITSLNTVFLNVSKAEVEAYDIAVSYQKTTAIGVFSLTAGATHQIHNSTQITPDLPFLDNVGNSQGGLRWTANATVSWDWRAFSAAWTTRYYGSYCQLLATAIAQCPVDPDQGAATIPSQTYHDVVVSYHLPWSLFSSQPLTSTTLSFGVRNVFNTSPPIVASQLLQSGIPYSTYGDPRLANYYLSVRTNF